MFIIYTRVQIVSAVSYFGRSEKVQKVSLWAVDTGLAILPVRVPGFIKGCGGVGLFCRAFDGGYYTLVKYLPQKKLGKKNNFNHF